MDMLLQVRTWTDSGFVLDPGFYAGRPPGDVTPKILEQFYTGIRQDFGETAAVNFVRFINKLEDLSASSFIMAFMRFAETDFTKVDIPQYDTDRDELSSGDGKFTQAAILLGQALAGMRTTHDSAVDQSRPIKWEFLSSHRGQIPRNEHVDLF